MESLYGNSRTGPSSQFTGHGTNHEGEVHIARLNFQPNFESVANALDVLTLSYDAYNFLHRKSPLQMLLIPTRISQILILISSSALFGCGGGGGGDATTGSAAAPPVTAAPLTPIPSSGNFALLYKVEGLTTAPRSGVSLIHPADRSTEYVIEPPALNVSSPITIYSGTVDAVNSKVSNLSAHSLLYIAGGDVKRLPLTATGTHPKAALQVAGATNLCDFVVDNFYRPQGTDFGTPLASRYLATTRGADNICASADDGQVEISFDAQGKPQTAALQNAAALGPVLAVLRNPATLKPSANVHGRAIVVTQPSAIVHTLVTGTAPAMTKAVAVSVDALVGQQNNRLVVWDISGKNVALDATITAGTGWESIGFDANNFYVYRNTGALATLPTSTWKLVKISRQSPAATLLASGAGYIQSASLGLNSIFVTSANVSGFSLNRLSKEAPSAPAMLSGPSITQIPATLASAQGVQLVLTISAGANGQRNIAISVLEEETSKTLYSNANALPLNLLAGTTLALNATNDAVGFVITGDASATAGALGATVISYDAATRTPVVVGRLPSVGDFGFSVGYAATGGTTTNSFDTGTLSGLSATSILASPRRIFSFEPRVADSMQYTTSVR